MVVLESENKENFIIKYLKINSKYTHPKCYLSISNGHRKEWAPQSSLYWFLPKLAVFSPLYETSCHDIFVVRGLSGESCSPENNDLRWDCSETRLSISVLES